MTQPQWNIYITQYEKTEENHKRKKCGRRKKKWFLMFICLFFSSFCKCCSNTMCPNDTLTHSSSTSQPFGRVVVLPADDQAEDHLPGSSKSQQANPSVGGGGVGEVRRSYIWIVAKTMESPLPRIKPRQMPPRFGRARSTREPPDPRLRRSQLGSSARRHHRIFMSGRRATPCQVM